MRTFLIAFFVFFIVIAGLVISQEDVPRIEQLNISNFDLNGITAMHNPVRRRPKSINK